MKAKAKSKKTTAKKVVASPSGFVYFIQEDLYKTVKIGETKDVGKRLLYFGVKLPFNTALIHAIYSENKKKTEKLFHKFFSEKRMNGSEWFKLDTRDIRDIKYGNFPEEIHKSILGGYYQTRNIIYVQEEKHLTKVDNQSKAADLRKSKEDNTSNDKVSISKTTQEKNNATQVNELNDESVQLPMDSIIVVKSLKRQQKTSKDLIKKEQEFIQNNQHQSSPIKVRKISDKMFAIMKGFEIYDAALKCGFEYINATIERRFPCVHIKDIVVPLELKSACLNKTHMNKIRNMLKQKAHFPLIRVKQKDDKYELIEGYSIYVAAKNLGWQEIITYKKA